MTFFKASGTADLTTMHVLLHAPAENPLPSVGRQFQRDPWTNEVFKVPIVFAQVLDCTRP